MKRTRPSLRHLLRLLSPLVLAYAVVLSMLGAAAVELRPEAAMSERVAKSIWLVEDVLRAAAPQTGGAGDDVTHATPASLPEYPALASHTARPHAEAPRPAQWHRRGPAIRAPPRFA